MKKLDRVPPKEVWTDGKKNFYAGDEKPANAKLLYTSNKEIEKVEKGAKNASDS